MKALRSLGNTAFFIVGMMIILIGAQAFSPIIVRGKVLSASSLYDLSIVTYEKGETEFIYNDYDYSSSSPRSWSVRATVDAIPSRDPGSPEFKAPNIELIGASEHKEVHVFDDPDSNECQRNILFLDRTKMEKEHFVISRTDYCVKNIVDEWDMTTFFAVNSENTKIALGNVADGTIFASIDAANVSSRPGHNWENTKIVFTVGEMTRDDDTRKLFLWDVNANILIDKTAVLRTVNEDIGFIHYVRETDSFDLYSGNFDSTLHGEGEFRAYKKLASFK
ncbi:MAG: hypothetical protein AAB473_00580 [Patescibacteria group bacterium]